LRFEIYILLFVLISCKKVDPYIWHDIRVTATAYNSLAYQTSSDPNITAYGDSLVPGNKYVAVSRDLIKLGVKHNTPIKIEGFEGVYLVKDKMHARWKKRIDIYMGVDVKAAKTWGRKKVNISYGILKDID
jgi:3D (Asp-Asp-Asp) domain-containing protein